mmetsp:Transcript_17161/g.47215  ORF Transcript_17161/g.47215 Transcript_17161/m.47215 type:complete len:140 (-) Transcript_17161:5799-6218(-)
MTVIGNDCGRKVESAKCNQPTILHTSIALLLRLDTDLGTQQVDCPSRLVPSNKHAPLSGTESSRVESSPVEPSSARVQQEFSKSLALVTAGIPLLCYSSAVQDNTNIRICNLTFHCQIDLDCCSFLPPTKAFTNDQTTN